MTSYCPELQLPESRARFHLLSLPHPSVPGDSYHDLSLLGRFLNSCLKVQLRGTHVCMDFGTCKDTHTHSSPQKYHPGSRKAALSLFHPADPASLFLKLHSCRSMKACRSKCSPSFLMLGLLPGGETPFSPPHVNSHRLS